MCSPFYFIFFFFNDTATTEIYTLSLHDALPIFPVFSDLLTRVVVQRVPALQEYEIVEVDRGHWRVGLSPLPPDSVQGELVAGLISLSESLGAEPPTLKIDSVITPPTSAKRRRVRGFGATSCAS